MEVGDYPKNAAANVVRICGKCGSKLFADAPQGFCSLCLFKTGLDSLLGEEDEVLESSAGPIIMNFDDYELLKEIGRGGQGIVYRARQKSLNRTVALKVIGVGRWATEAHLKRFRLEAEAAASLNHPFIVPIHEIRERDGCCYFSMNLIEGGQLDEVVKRQAISIRRAAELIAKLARTVHYAHEHGILHRDIKPGNVLLDQEGEPHLTDFGLARLVESESTVTRTTDCLGTPSYMAPEQARGSSEVTKTTDIYGLGAVLYHLLTGRPPFVGTTSYETVRLLLETDPRQPRLLNPKVDRDLGTICLKCLEKDPERRYCSALALAKDLERWLRHEPIQARRTGLVTRGKKWLHRNPTTAVLGVSVSALLVALGMIIWRSELFHPPPTNATVVPEKSIAVMPFVNSSGDKSNAYFTDGIQDEILSRLSKIAELKVISRTSTEKYKRSPRNLREVGQQLRAANILEGQVQKAGDQVRITVQLINASSDSHLWANTYDRKLVDMFGVESEVAQKIASSLQARLTGSERKAVTARPTENAQAYQLYLKGRFFWNKRTGADLKTAAGYFQQAIAADPDYANAYAGLAQANLLMPFYNAGAPQDVFSRAKIAATRAIALDDTCSEGHAALAMLLCYDFKFRESEAEFKRAIELDPNYATAHQWYGNTLLTTLGQFDEAIKEGERAIELDPFSLIINTDLGSTFILARRYDEAIAQLRRTLTLDGNFTHAREVLGTALSLEGDVNAAIGEFEKVRDNDNCGVLGLLGWVYAVAGRRAEAMQILQELKECGQKRYVRSLEYALVYIGLGQKQTAIEYLEKSTDNSTLTWLKIDPLFDPLRDEPRFQKLLAKSIPPAR